MRALVRFERNRYRQSVLNLDQRVTPLIDAEGPEDMYSRATLVFACLRETLGDRVIVDALRGMAERSTETFTPARSIDFVRTVTASARPDLRKPVEALFLASTPLDSQLAGMRCAAE